MSISWVRNKSKGKERIRVGWGEDKKTGGSGRRAMRKRGRHGV